MILSWFPIIIIFFWGNVGEYQERFVFVKVFIRLGEGSEIHLEVCISLAKTTSVTRVGNFLDTFLQTERDQVEQIQNG